MVKSLLSVLALIAVSFGASADENLPTLVSVPLTGAYIPGGFDSNDRAQLVIEGFFPNTCYRLGPTEKSLDQQTGKLSVRQKAYKYRGPCLMMIVPFTETVKVGLLKANDYTVVDGESGRDLGKLPVREAINSGPDDVMYAIIRDAYVGKVDGVETAIIIQGELPGTCWSITETRVVKDGTNVLAVLPIMAKTSDSNCSDVRVPFVTSAKIPEGTTGRFLLHVRSLNGEAINKVVEL